MSPVEPIVDQLRAIVERLDDLSFDELQRALADGRNERPAIDRQMTRARRAIERAISILEDDAGTAQTERYETGDD